MNILRQVHKKLSTILKKVCKHLKHTLIIHKYDLASIYTMQNIQSITLSVTLNMFYSAGLFTPRALLTSYNLHLKVRDNDIEIKFIINEFC